jgi:predicted nucleotidyltransferase
MLDPKVELDKLVTALETDVPSLGLAELEEEKLIELSDSTHLAFCSVVGSWNYGLADKNSDVDFKVTYLPSFKHFYDHKFPKLNVVGKNVDFTLAPFNTYVEHVLKGNINFFEVLYTAQPYWFYTDHPEVHDIMEILREMVPMNAVRMRDACMGTAAQKIKGLHKYSLDNEHMEEDFGFNLKEMAHALRQLGFLMGFMDHGKIDLQGHYLMKAVKSIKKGLWTESMGMEQYEKAEKFLGEKWAVHKFDKLDQTETPRWEELKENLEEQVYALCWKKSL